MELVQSTVKQEQIFLQSDYISLDCRTQIHWALKIFKQFSTFKKFKKKNSKRKIQRFRDNQIENGSQTDGRDTEKVSDAKLP